MECNKCREEKGLTRFCNHCKREDYYKKRYPMPCNSCGKNRPISTKSHCDNCLKDTGYNRCIKCNEELLFIHFTKLKDICDDCKIPFASSGNRAAALTPTQIQEAANLYKTGVTFEEIGGKFGVASSTIRRTLIREQKDYKANNRYDDRFNKRYFENIDTPDKAYWLGFIATDGCVYKDALQIAIKEKNHLEKLVKCIGGENVLNLYYRIDKRNKSGIWIFKVRCKEMVADLLSHGITERKTFTVKPWNGPEELMRDYWRGCMDGDGWIYEDLSRISFCGNEFMITGFKEWLLDKILLSYDIKPQRNIFYINIFNKQEKCKILNILYYENVSIALDRKLALANKLIIRQFRCM